MPPKYKAILGNRTRMSGKKNKGIQPKKSQDPQVCRRMQLKNKFRSFARPPRHLSDRVEFSRFSSKNKALSWVKKMVDCCETS